MTGRRWALALALAASGLWGCGPADLPPPKVLSISPAAMAASSVANVTVAVSAVLPFTVDYGKPEVTVTPTLILGVGPVIVGSGRYENAGMLPARVPSRLKPGVYDVTLSLSPERVGTLPAAFTVTQGTWPTGYMVSTVASPVPVDAPVSITIVATMPPATQPFHGTVDFYVSNPNGSTLPAPTEPFVNGVLTMSITPNTRGFTTFTVVDLEGTTANTTFTVN